MTAKGKINSRAFSFPTGTCNRNLKMLGPLNETQVFVCVRLMPVILVWQTTKTVLMNVDANL